jgi:hypothetical protein
MRPVPNLLGAWPSDTKMLPSGATATLVGRSNAFGPVPATPSVPSVISTLPLEFSFSTSWPITTPAAFFAGMPRMVS